MFLFSIEEKNIFLVDKISGKPVKVRRGRATVRGSEPQEVTGFYKSGKAWGTMKPSQETGAYRNGHRWSTRYRRVSLLFRFLPEPMGPLFLRNRGLIYEKRGAGSVQERVM